MFKKTARLVLLFIVPILLFACSGKKLNLEVKALLDGKPASAAKILLDGKEVGLTDDQGEFKGVLRKEPGREVSISVTKEQPGYRIEPWQETFMMKAPDKGAIDTYAFDVELKAMMFVNVTVSAEGAPLAGATVKVGGKEGAITGEDGTAVYEYAALPKGGLKFSITKKGYSNWRKTVKVEPGQTLAVELYRSAVFTFKPLTEEYGRTKGMAGIVVKMGKKRLGKTGRKGTFSYAYKGEPGKKATFSLHAPGYTPSVWKKTLTLTGGGVVKKYFYLKAVKPVRVGIYGYASNVPDEDIKSALTRLEEAVANNLFSYMIFKEVPGKALRDGIKTAKTDMTKMTTKGWRNTSLYRTADAVVLGSVSRQGDQLVVETKVYSSDGQLVLSQINRARGIRDMKKVAKKIVKNIFERFPFDASVVGKDGKRFKINIGTADYKIKRGMEFAVMAPSFDNDGRIQSYRDIGTLRVKSARKNESLADVVEMKKGNKAAVGYRAVRRMYTGKERETAKHSLSLVVKGGLKPNVAPLGDVNIYLDDMWIGTTDSKGKASVPVRLGKSYDIVLYRHGYRQMSGEVKAARDKEVKEFVLEVNNALFKVDSVPSGAKVFLDDKPLAKTPILKGKNVNFGFHTLRVSAGGEYRDLEQVVEFNRKVVDLTGKNSIVLFKDYLKQGEKEEKKGNWDAAVATYLKAGKDHPDYSDARFSLAQIYMDELDDYPSAIQEFENVLSLPENEQLIFKQYAVTYTNLGHAYYEVGNGLIQSDRQAAAESLAKAIKNLEMAKQNTRFLPTDNFDEAVHDTYYYLALSYHKLYLLTRKDTILDKADMGWREYFDFFPESLKDKEDFAGIRESAEKYRAQIKDIR